VTGSGSLQADFNRIYLTNCLQCKLLSYEEYRLILYFIAGVYVFFLGIGLWSFSYEVRSTYTLVGAIFILITAVMTLLNIIIIIRIIHVPKEKLALASGLVMILLMISNIIIFVSLYNADDDTRHAILAMNILFAAFQFYASYILYRYAEFVKFNYDENISGTKYIWTVCVFSI
jgi:Kef-type K+ transport system membrane component KefB